MPHRNTLDEHPAAVGELQPRGEPGGESAGLRCRVGHLGAQPLLEDDLDDERHPAPTRPDAVCHVRHRAHTRTRLWLATKGRWTTESSWRSGASVIAIFAT